MKIKKMNRGFWLVTMVALLMVGGCGYKPSTHYIQKIFSGSVYADVIVSRAEPENAVYVKDALHQMIIARFGGKIAPKSQAQNVITASYNGTTFTPISYDANGYITRYRADVQMLFVVRTSKGTFKRAITTYVEENIQASSALSSSLRIQAIRQGMEKALDQFLAYVSARGAMSKASAE
jgi:hypothetical protein